MADEEAPIPKTFEELFVIYSNYKANPLDVDNEVYEAILLTQIDLWLEKAGLLKTTFTMTETGMAWMKFKKWRLDYDEFIEFLKDLCGQKELELDDVKDAMTEAGKPSAEPDQPVAVK